MRVLRKKAQAGGGGRRSSKLFSVVSKVISHSGVKLDLKTKIIYETGC